MKLDTVSHRRLTFTLFGMVAAAMLLSLSYFGKTEFGVAPTIQTWLLPALLVVIPLAGFLLSLRSANRRGGQ